MAAVVVCFLVMNQIKDAALPNIDLKKFLNVFMLMSERKIHVELNKNLTSFLKSDRCKKFIWTQKETQK